MLCRGLRFRMSTILLRLLWSFVTRRNVSVEFSIQERCEKDARRLLIFLVIKCIGQPPVHTGRWPLFFLDHYIDARAHCVGVLLDESRTRAELFWSSLAVIRYFTWLNDNFFFVRSCFVSIRLGFGIEFQDIAGSHFHSFIWSLGAYPSSQCWNSM